MKKNILFISPTGTLDNGAEISIFHLMKYLVREDYHVINAIPDYHVQVQQDYISTLAKEGIRTSALPSVKWWWEDAPGGLPGTHEERVNSYQENIAALRKLMVDSHIDLVITNTVNMFQGAVAAACEDIPHFWLIHEFPEGEFSYYKEKIGVINSLADEIFTVTGNLQKSLSFLLPQREIKSFISHNEVVSIKLKQGSKKRFVSVGRVNDNKNQIELIQAYQNLENASDYELVFIGGWDETYKKKCDDYIQKNRLTNIFFLGHKDNPWEELTSEDICVFTSKIETFGLVYIEAILNGIPTIISDNQGYMTAYNLFEIGTIYQLGNIEQLTGILQDSIKNFSQQKDFVVKQRERIQNVYRIENNYAELLSAITEDNVRNKKILYYFNSLFEFKKVSERKITHLFKKIIRRIIK